MHVASVCEAAPAAQPRRRLAENVICLFPVDHPQIINRRWRGRYPRNVRRLFASRYFLPGDVVQYRHGRNAGTRVCIVSLCRDTRDLGPGIWYEVKAVSALLHTIDIATGRRDTEPQLYCVAEHKDLHRIPASR